MNFNVMYLKFSKRKGSGGYKVRIPSMFMKKCNSSQNALIKVIDMLHLRCNDRSKAVNDKL